MKKKQTILIRVIEVEKELLMQAADKTGQSISDFIRNAFKKEIAGVYTKQPQQESV
jgi:uncharacterized protein (DUF1778 family)